MEIQEFSLTYIDEVVELIHKLQVEHWRQYSRWYEPAPDALNNIKKILLKDSKKRHTKIFIAIHKGHLVGYVYCKLDKNPPIYLIQKEGYISGLYVRSAHRNKGVAKALLSAAMNWFAKQKVPIVTLKADVANDYGRMFWLKQGFTDQQHVMVTYIDEGRRA